MELKEFIQTTLTQIIEGVFQARHDVNRSGAATDGAVVSPYVYGATGFHMKGGHPVQLVEFDVALTVMESSEVKAGGGAKLAILSIGANGNVASQSTAVNRIKFSVPVAMPRDPEPSSGRHQTHAISDYGDE